MFLSKVQINQFRFVAPGFFWQPVAKCEWFTRTDNNCTLNNILQFTNIPRPIVIHQAVDDFLRNLCYFLSDFWLVLLQKCFTSNGISSFRSLLEYEASGKHLIHYPESSLKKFFSTSFFQISVCCSNYEHFTFTSWISKRSSLPVTRM